MRGYVRAPTFLMLTGYEQVRSLACALTGDVEGARQVELELPATGVCCTDGPAAPTVSGRVLSLFQPAAAGGACCG